MLVAEAPHALREPEAVERRDERRHVAERERDRALLPEAVHAEAAHPGRRVRSVEVAGVDEVVVLARRSLRHDVEDRLRVVVRDERLLERDEHAVHAHARGRVDLQVEVGAAELDRLCEEVDDVHGGSAPLAYRRRRAGALAGVCPRWGMAFMSEP